jgi:L-glyceraldehyde 3-phosphate reductase
MSALICRSFDLGITHFDLANNYGPPPGSAEINFGKILKAELKGYRDELIISTKAGWRMWPGPYGDLGSRKYMVASLDQSLQRMGLDYVDIYYHHRPDPGTPLDETMAALDQVVRQGKAIYAGISSYSPKDSRRAAVTLRDLGTPLTIHQPSYNMFNRWVEKDNLLHTARTQGFGMIAFCPLAQGMLTDRYLNGVPDDSRAGKNGPFLKKDNIKPETLDKVRRLDAVAKARGQTLAQMALTWVLRHPEVTSALIGASKVSQIEDNVAALKAAPLCAEELATINAICAS